MAAFGVVLLVVFGLTACALVLFVVAVQVVREAPEHVPSAAELAHARRRADALAFREAELDELRSQGPEFDRELLAGLGPMDSSARPRQSAGETFDSA